MGTHRDGGRLCGAVAEVFSTKLDDKLDDSARCGRRRDGAHRDRGLVTLGGAEPPSDSSAFQRSDRRCQRRRQAGRKTTA